MKIDKESILLGMNKCFALIDCNNFFVSCEKVFRPELEGRPVLVLSSNDGCVVSRSNEAKKLGIPMGAPVFKFKDIVDKHRMVVFSSNFGLYGDMSQRVNQVLQSIIPEIEMYSIDETFVDIASYPFDRLEFGCNVRSRILRETGIPVSAGIGPSKTLAKLATEIAKIFPDQKGAFSFDGMSDISADVWLDKFPVGEVWGVGRRLAPRLNQYGVMSARDLKYAPQTWLHKNFSIQLLKTVKELNGESCIELDPKGGVDKKSITCSRSFGESVYDLYQLQEAIVSHLARAAYQLRKQDSVASRVTVYARSSKHTKQQSSYSKMINLSVPTSYTPDIIRAVLPSVSKLYRPGVPYKKAGIYLGDVQNFSQTNLLEQLSESEFERQDAIMRTVDQINKRWGSDFVKFGQTNNRRTWHSSAEKRSPAYTRTWTELPVVKAQAL